MLKHLSIKNVAVIEACDIDFEMGFNVLTGETGAGKSIIIDAINMLRGERASKEIIRAGESKARVDGVFEVDEKCAEEIADILGTEPECEIMISRELSSDGKNNVRINGMPASIAVLKTIGENLASIHGQHDNTSLLSTKSHIVFLDRFGKDETATLLEKYKEIHSSLLDKIEQLNSISTNEDEKLRRRDMLLFQIEELSEANFKEGEEEELKARKLVLDNSHLIAQNTTLAYDMLYGSDKATCHDILWSAIDKLNHIADYSPEIREIVSALTDAGYIIDENARELRSASGSDFDPEELSDIEKRLDLIYTLERKYGSTVSDMLAFLEKAQNELEEIDTSDEKIELLQAEIKELTQKRADASKALTEKREKCARILEKEVKAHLADLDMAKVDFEVSIEEAPFGSDGADSVEFLICTNVGEDKKSLSKIASGGELSRIMLAIKNSLASFEGSKTMIFDEIDTGVSGSAAQKIGEKLYNMSVFSQVLCITHLPQISSLADVHFLIKKSVTDNRTSTTVEPLSFEGRAEEIARTLGGKSITDIAKENARELLNDANNIKLQIKNKLEEK